MPSLCPLCLCRFGQGTFGRLYKARLRPELTSEQMPPWVAQQVRKRAHRRQQEDDADHIESMQDAQQGAAAAASAAAASAPVRPCVLGDDDIHSACNSVRTPRQSSATDTPSLSDPTVAATISALRSETLVIKEVPFNGLPTQEQEDIINEVRVMSAVNHSAFVAYYESFIDNGACSRRAASARAIRLVHSSSCIRALLSL